MDALKINEMLEKRVRDLARTGGTVAASERSKFLRQALSLEPLPPKTDLRAQVTGTLEGEGYRLEKLRYEARPGELVTAHLYLPAAPGKHPVILSPHGHWAYKKSTPHIQSRGISLALEGFACLTVDSPGYSWDENDTNERRGMGSHDDWFLAMGAALQGIYVWDLMRGLDYLETRPECDTSRVGITGSSGGGTASLYAFAVDSRIGCAAPVCSMASFETATTDGCLCNHVPGVMQLGDRSDLLLMRAPAPVLIVGATVDADFPADATQRTYDKLRKVLKSKARLAIVEANHDYNRRMRESVVAFFKEILQGEPRREHKAEIRPLTDGWENNYPGGTYAAEDPVQWVLPVADRQTITMRDILTRQLAEPYPEAYDSVARLVPWGRYGRLGTPEGGAILAIHDEDIENPKDLNSVPLPVRKINGRDAFYIGLSVSEVMAQMLHLALPGSGENWEAAALQGSPALTSIMASVKTLVSPGHAPGPPRMVSAEGPISSMVALVLARYRPDLEVEISHSWSSWSELLESGIPELSQPGARYLEFPTRLPAAGASS